MEKINKFKVFLIVLLLLISCADRSPSNNRNKYKQPPIKVSENGHFLQKMNGEPFFWLGDTGWELFHRLSRSEALKYLENRKAKGFNVIQAVALYELEAMETPNFYGDFPLKDSLISQPAVTPGNNPNNEREYDYWDHVEWIIEKAAKMQIKIGLLPCWGEYITPRFRDRTIRNPEQGYNYGWFIGDRLKKLNNHIIWILGGDRLPDEHSQGVQIWRAMAEGITDAINGVKNFDNKSDYTTTFMTYHCYRSSSTWFHEDKWIDMHTWGSYHEKRNNERAFLCAPEDWNLCDPKPTLNSEPAYELLPINYKWKDASLGYFDDFDVRQVAYWSVFTGACGHTYGCHPIWQMYKKENPHPPLTNTVQKEWEAALDEPGAFQMTHLKRLILSRPFFSRRPNQKVLIENPHDPTGYLTASTGDGYIFVYIPTGKPVQVKTSTIASSEIEIWLYNPRNGTIHSKGKQKNSGKLKIDPSGKTERGNDWVLVIDNADRKYTAPGIISE